MKDVNVHDSHLGFFKTANKVVIDLEHPTPEMIVIEDIATALGNICRFGGHTDTFYSVAQHSVLVTLLAIINKADEETVKVALLHDAAEAYIGDVIKPLKIKLGDAYREYELLFEEVIFKRFGLNTQKLEDIKVYDKIALEIENNYLRKEASHDDWDAAFLSKYKYADAWDCEKATIRFLEFYEDLFDK